MGSITLALQHGGQHTRFAIGCNAVGDEV